MELSVIIIATIVVVLFVVPFVYIHHISEIRKRKFSRTFTNLAAKHQVNISEMDLWNNTYAIGIDTGSRKLLYMSKKGENTGEVLIDLNEVENCFKSDGNRLFKNGESFSKMPEKLLLGFTIRSQNSPEKSLEFYNETVDGSLTDETNILLKWQKIVNEVIGNRNRQAR